MGNPTPSTEQLITHESPVVAIVLTKGDGGLLHLGLVYQQGKQCNYFHLAWENKLFHQGIGKLKEPYIWACPAIPEPRLRGVIAACRKVQRTWKAAVKRRGRGKMPYGIAFNGSAFDMRTGKLRLGRGSVGLTCATFVLAIFNSIRLLLIDETTVPERTEANLEWAQSLGSSALRDRVVAEIQDGAKRILPQEVVGSCALSDPPNSIPAIEPHAAFALELMNSACGQPSSVGLVVALDTEGQGENGIDAALDELSTEE